MFNNLIESSSHRREFTRRGSFVLFTAATYVMLFVGAGVMSIYAYDASLSDPSSELELISFVPPQPDKVAPEPLKVRRSEPPKGSPQVDISTRPVLIDRTDNPLNPPKEASAVALPFPPAHENTEVGSEVRESSGPGRVQDGGDSGPGGSGTVAVVRIPDPPPTPAPTPAPKKVFSSPIVLNSQALELPKPPYPVTAKQIGVQGVVSVQVLIDETGKVISAKAVSGSPLLTSAAQQAAYRARFSPTKIGNQAVKVSGVITYNFVLQ